MIFYMVKFTLFIFILFISCSISAQERFKFSFISDTIHYRKLEFDDFKQSVVNKDTLFLHYFFCCYDSFMRTENGLNSKQSGLVNASSSVDFITEYIVKNDTVFYAVFPFLYPKLSYIIIKNNSTLAHEQIHFDIFELYSRKIKKEICSVKFTGNNTVLLDNIITLYRHKADSLQKKFDADALLDQLSNHTVSLSNKIWSEKINKEIELLKDYTAPYGNHAIVYPTIAIPVLPSNIGRPTRNNKKAK